MNCKEARSHLTRLGAGSPSVRSVSEHLAGCASCAAYAALLARARQALGEHHAGHEPDAGFAARVVAALPDRRGILLGRAAMNLLPAALALVLVLAGWVAIEERGRAAPQEMSPTDDLLGWVLQDPEETS